MSVDVQQIDKQKNVILWTFTPDWTWEDFYEALHKLNDIASQHNGLISVIVDTRRASIRPALLTHMRKTVRLLPKSIEKSVVVTRSHFLVALVNTLLKSGLKLPHQVIFTEAIEEAYRAVNLDASEVKSALK